MHQYKLIYFNGRGRAEIIRQVFALAGVEYEDYRMTDPKNEWPVFKKTAPFGQAPLLQIDGQTVLAQSLAISRYLARKFGVAGKSELDQANVDMIVDCVEDFRKPLMGLFVPNVTEEEKVAIKKKFSEDQMPVSLEKFEKLLSASQSGFFVGDEMTWGDVYFTIALDFLSTLGIEAGLDKYPNIAAFKTRVQSNERIAQWLAKRPESNF